MANPNYSLNPVRELLTCYQRYPEQAIYMGNNIREFFSGLEYNIAREHAMHFIVNTKQLFSFVKKDAEAAKVIEEICLGFKSYLKRKSIKPKRDETLRAAVPDELWEKCFNIIIQLEVTNFASAVDNVLAIENAENEKRKTIVQRQIEKSLNVDEEFCAAVRWIKIFKLHRLKEKNFQKIVLNAHVFEHAEILEEFLTKSDRHEYIEILKNSFLSVINGSSLKTKHEQTFVEEMTLPGLYELLQNEADRYNVKLRLTFELCTIFNKSYKMITVNNVNQMEEFIQSILINTKSQVIGIDCEATPNNKLVTIQLATKEWLCIIDIYGTCISKRYNWINLFANIFNSKFICVGFAFDSDYKFISNTFPDVKDLMQKSKIICLKSLVETILKTPEAKNVVFSNKQLASLSLSNITEAILGYSLNKDLQCSDWTKRPLTFEQKQYAVTDALVAIQIKEKIEDILNKNFGNAKTLQIINQAYMHFPKVKENISAPVKPATKKMNKALNNRSSKPQKTAAKCLKFQCMKCNSSNYDVISSAFYNLTLKIITMINETTYSEFDEKCWNNFRKAILQALNSSDDNENITVFASKSVQLSRRLIFDSNRYEIRPLTAQLYCKNDKRVIGLSESIFKNLKHESTHVIVCLNCGNMCLQENNNAIKTKKIKMQHNEDAQKMRKSIIQMFLEISQKNYCYK